MPGSPPAPTTTGSRPRTQPGNVGPALARGHATATSDTSAPTAPATLTATPGRVRPSLTWTASTDNVGVVRYDVHRSTHVRLHALAGQPNRAADDARPTRTPASPPAPTTTRSSQLTPAATSPLRRPRRLPSSPQPHRSASSPPTVSTREAARRRRDSSGNGNTGTVSGATWTIGKFGTALSFDGTNDIVIVPDSASLDLTTGMTLEAWLLPARARLSLADRSCSRNRAATTHTVSTGAPARAARARTRSPEGPITTCAAPHRYALDTWTHVAATYDGATLRLYVDGTLASSAAATGAISTSTGAFRIGGNTLWGEYFQGLIDEVRIYNRALSQTEIQTDMARRCRDRLSRSFRGLGHAGGRVVRPRDRPERPPRRSARRWTPATINSTTFELLDGAERRCPPCHLRPDHCDGDADAHRRPDLRQDLHGANHTAAPAGVKDMSGRLPGSRLHLDVQHRSSRRRRSLSSPRRPTRTRPTQARSCGRRASASRPSTRRLISPTVLGFYDAIVLGDVTLDARTGDHADELGPRRREPRSRCVRTNSLPACWV